MGYIRANEYRRIAVNRRTLVDHPEYSAIKTRVIEELRRAFETEYGTPVPEGWIKCRLDPDELTYPDDDPVNPLDWYGTITAYTEPPVLNGCAAWDAETGLPTPEHS